MEWGAHIVTPPNSPWKKAPPPPPRRPGGLGSALPESGPGISDEAKKLAGRSVAETAIGAFIGFDLLSRALQVVGLGGRFLKKGRETRSARSSSSEGATSHPVGPLHKPPQLEPRPSPERSISKSGNSRRPVLLVGISSAVLVLAVLGFAVLGSSDSNNEIAAVVSTSAAPQPVVSQSVGDSASADYISRSVVLVTVSTSSGEICWTGSGVAVLDGTSILTNDHVVTPEPGDDPACSNISVGITDDPAVEPNHYVQGMTVVSNDPELDLALLKMPAGGEVRLRPLSILNDRLKIDTKIRIIGYPGVGGDTITLNEGVVSGVDKRSGTEFYKVSAQISPGNSGGPMVDSAGNLVGIATAYMPADVTCEDRDKCYAEGANLGLVRPIALASSLLSR